MEEIRDYERHDLAPRHRFLGSRSLPPRREQAEREWRSVRTAFPLDVWSTLDLRRYALGTGEQGTFCWWMEFGMPISGSIAGGNAQKHLIFKRANGDWYYPDDFRSVEEAWTTIRAELVEAIRLAGLGDFAGIGALPHLLNGSRTVAKAIFTYHPDSLMPVFARGHRDRKLAIMDFESSDTLKFAHCSYLLLLPQDVGYLAARLTFGISRAHSASAACRC
jgi:hypothetical protein